MVEICFDLVRGGNCNLDTGKFLLTLNQLQRTYLQNSPHYLQLPHIKPNSINISTLEENKVVYLEICNYVPRNYCKSCVYLVYLNISSNFTNIHVLHMDKF